MMSLFKWFSCAILITLSIHAWADRVHPLSLPEIAASAATIFEGECVDIRSGVDEQSGLLATWYTFKVTNRIKGDLSETFTFKQYGGSDGERRIASPSAQYEKGKTVIVFLYGTSKIGFSSAVGLTQGKFSVIEHPATKKMVVSNGMPAAILFKNTPFLPAAYDGQGKRLQGAKQLQAKQLDHNEFIAVVQELIESASKDAKKEKE
ncbi:MAG: hypothetical protein P9L94_10380 [Candidatus Hinthialibacter antarcticus]|nr:hypothetical protein [Candidatus Hinthialibacter antarcticus]